MFCADHVYAKAQADYDKTLEARGLPVSGHAGIPDTAEMMYVGKGKDWVRTDMLKYAFTVGPDGGIAPPTAPGAGRGAADPNAPRFVATGVGGSTGRPADARPST